MPIYEYRCRDCGHQLEILQKITDSPLQDCPACHQPTLTKQISVASFHLKGSGWYKTNPKETEPPACSSGTCCACAQPGT